MNRDQKSSLSRRRHDAMSEARNDPMPASRCRFVLTISLATAFLVCGPLVAAGGEDEPIGRLFFTPERRAAMDRQRQYNVQQTRVMEGASVTVDGVVQRSSGKSTVWINGVPHYDHQAASDVQPQIDAHDPSRVVLKPGDEPRASLRVGETLNRTTREKQDPLDGGQITVRRAASPTP